MPHKDPEKRKQYMAQYGRKWYEAHRSEVIAKVAKRKHTDYAGVCVNCGGPTVGNTKGGASQYCGRPECKSVQRRNSPRVRQAVKYHTELTRWKKQREGITLDDLLEELETKRRS